MMRKEFSSERKEKTKRIRTIAELVILAVLVILSFLMLFNFKRYRTWNAGLTEMGDTGAFALMIPGVGRIQTDSCLDVESLEALLKELKRQGYVSVSQEDVTGYFEEDEQLPEKSVFLIFQDGKRDTAELAQTLLEKYNFKATMLESDETDQKEKYLSDRDQKTLIRSTFWEIGIADDLLEKLEPVQVDPCWGVNHLLLELGISIEEESANLPKAMTLKQGYAELTENRLKLTTDEKGTGKITFLPDETFYDASISVEFYGDSEGTQQIGMRVTKKNGVYIRVTDDKIQLLQKIGGNTELVDDMDLSMIKKGEADGYQTSIRLSDSGVTVYINNRIVFNNVKISVSGPGKITLTSSSKVNGKKSEDHIYDAEFRNLSVHGDGKEIFDGSMKWYQSLLHALKEAKRDFTAWIQQTGQ